MLSCMIFSNGQNESFNVGERKRKWRVNIENVEDDFQEAETAIRKRVATHNRRDTRDSRESAESITKNLENLQNLKNLFLFLFFLFAVALNYGSYQFKVRPNVL